MALKSTIFKVNLSVSDLDRPYYAEHELTLARHPSETDLRMLLRMIVFAIHAGPELRLCKGLSTDDEPDLWSIGATGEIIEWIELGQVEPKRLRKASGKANQVFVYTYQKRSADVWWQKNQSLLSDIDNLQACHLDADALTELTDDLPRQFSLSCTRQDGLLWLNRDSFSTQLEPTVWR